MGGKIVGWVDYDVEREWLLPGEVNVGYSVFGASRGRGYATRAVQLLMHHLALNTRHHTATLAIDPDNVRSLALAERSNFIPRGVIGESRYFKRRVPPRTYSDGTVVLRSLGPQDIERHLEAIDDEQIDWLWLPGHRDEWESKTADEQRAHQHRYLQECGETFGDGPQWRFAVDAKGADYVVYVDCDLANPHVPRGEANVSYTTHPDYRGKGYASRAVCLVLRFLRENTGARQAHIVVDAENVASLRVAHAIGATESERFVNEHGRVSIRHVMSLRSS